ncbi:four-carbon acid sugar kinase family protein [Pseudomonas luteola]|uniref:3-oxo-tetronate kinase n=1 Tax=Pseudomonas luteola TaxID=47886 RepID=UPI000F78DD4D|nr:3-oxo-tetronate kinase [Pseudomonas luteola]RRW39900.1 four-carbon acid sugar kinase family protein [Pseudomonas luteola]
MSRPLIGCIADDFTGGTDLASTLVQGGMRTVQVIGVPKTPLSEPTDAIVVALKSRTLPVDQAIEESLAALEYLKAAGCRQFFFKYCSTFDSTKQGNIGPVADALLENLGETFALMCPAFPQNGRTLYNGYLFVGDAPLNESGMRNHPLTPMTDANLIRVLQSQTQGKVGLVPFSTVSCGAEAIRKRFLTAQEQGCRYVIVDALTDDNLKAIGESARDHVLITGGSGVALGLPQNFREQGLLPHASTASELPEVGGLSAVIAGSCSNATNAQVKYWQQSHPSFKIDPLLIASGQDVASEALAWAKDKVQSGPVLIYGSADPSEVRIAQEKLGAQHAGALVEDSLAHVAKGLCALGVRKLVVAGGETSGAVVKALEVDTLRIGAPIDPGVPWTLGLQQTPIALALKSGNFGSVDFFEKALKQVR